MEFENLFSLLEDAPVTLVLGAGSSFDYGLPLWADLKVELLNLAKTKSQSLNISDEVAKFWVEELSKSHANETLDQIAGSCQEREPYYAFQKLTAYALLKGEASKGVKRQSEQWIHHLVDCFVRYLRSQHSGNTKEAFVRRQETLSQLNVVSLNYDRVFLTHLLSAAKQAIGNDFLTRQEQDLLDWKAPNIDLQIIQPHGSLGNLYDVSRTSYLKQGGVIHSYGAGFVDVGLIAFSPYKELEIILPYGDTYKLEKMCMEKPMDERLDFNLVAVDDFIPGAIKHVYELANSKIEKSNVICLGLSQEGFNNSLLDFKTTKSVTFTNSEKELQEFDPSRMPNGNVYFEKNGIYASPLIKKLTQP